MSTNLEQHLEILQSLILKIDRVTQFELETLSKMALIYNISNKLNIIIDNVKQYEGATIESLNFVENAMADKLEDKINELANNLGLTEIFNAQINKLEQSFNQLNNEFDLIENKVDTFEGIQQIEFNNLKEDVETYNTLVDDFIKITYENNKLDINTQIDDLNSRIDFIVLETDNLDDILLRLEEIEQSTEIPNRVTSIEEKLSILEVNVNSNKGDTDLSIADLETKQIQDYEAINNEINNLKEVVSGFDSRISNIEARMGEIEQQWSDFRDTDFNYNVSQIMLEIDEIKETIRTYHTTE